MNLKNYGIDLNIIGTDAEASIVNGIRTVFPNATNIYCWKHFLENIY